MFISTFYSRKSELFLKKGGVILSGLATDIIVLYPALELNQFLPLAASRATAESVNSCRASGISFKHYISKLGKGVGGLSLTDLADAVFPKLWKSC